METSGKLHFLQNARDRSMTVVRQLLDCGAISQDDLFGIGFAIGAYADWQQRDTTPAAPGLPAQRHGLFRPGDAAVTAIEEFLDWFDHRNQGAEGDRATMVKEARCHLSLVIERVADGCNRRPPELDELPPHWVDGAQVLATCMLGAGQLQAPAPLALLGDVDDLPGHTDVQQDSGAGELPALRAGLAPAVAQLLSGRGQGRTH